ncbi:MAG: nitroreductase family deazaflavin-dependent oxidoreductase [Ferrimicrobium sp.]
MALSGEYEPSTQEWVRDQVERYERTNGREGGTLADTGLPVIILWTLGAKTGKLRKTPLMRVEHEGEYALVASKGGAPEHPFWFYNLVAHPNKVTIHDRELLMDATVRQIEGQERVLWWERAVAAFPPYAEYQTKTTRHIPVFVATAKS